MVNVKMEPVYALRDGMDDIARCRAATMVVLVMANAHWRMANIDVSASKVGLERIAPLHWS